jgi:hypothetical protein
VRWLSSVFSRLSMSALSHKPTFALQQTISALPLKADIRRCAENVRFESIGDIICGDAGRAV